MTARVKFSGRTALSQRTVTEPKKLIAGFLVQVTLMDESARTPSPISNRWLPLVKWLLAIPHYIVLFFLDIAASFVVIAAWFAVLFTGRYPNGMFTFVEGVSRWRNRVVGYAFTLVTDRYPPFRLAL